MIFSFISFFTSSSSIFYFYSYLYSLISIGSFCFPSYFYGRLSSILSYFSLSSTYFYSSLWIGTVVFVGGGGRIFPPAGLFLPVGFTLLLIPFGGAGGFTIFIYAGGSFEFWGSPKLFSILSSYSFFLSTTSSFSLSGPSAFGSSFYSTFSLSYAGWRLVSIMFSSLGGSVSS